MTPAEMFMKYDYAEMKDLLKTFITVVSDTIVFSLTFSDKITKFDNANNIVKKLMLVSWSMMIISLISSGVAIPLIASAAGKIIYGSIPFLDFEYWDLTYWSVAFAILAGSIFVVSLMMLMVSVATAYSGNDVNQSKGMSEQ